MTISAEVTRTRLRMRAKHREIVAHYLRYSDDKTPASDKEVRAFILWESRGIQTPGVDVARIYRGKQGKELFVKMVYEEVFYYWSQGWGWALPLVDIIKDENEHPLTRATFQTILETLRNRGVEDVLRAHPEFTDEQKNRWCADRNGHIAREKQ